MSSRTQSWCVQRIGTLTCLAVLLPTSHALAQAPSSAEQHLARRLAEKATVTWHGQQLGPALERVTQSQQIAVWLDRRVDPSAPVELAGGERTWSEILDSVAKPQACAATPFQGVVYFGPRQTAEELRTLAALARASLATAPASLRARWLSREPWSLARLSGPRQLLTELVKPTGAVVVGSELIPHDLWPARELPPMATLDRVVLLLAGFDLTCNISADGRQLQVIPIKRPVRITRRYAVGRERTAAVQSLLAEEPTAIADWKGQRLKVAGRVEVHDRIARIVRGGSSAARAPRRSSTPGVEPAVRQYTLKIENQPVGRVIDQLAEQLNLLIEWDERLLANPAAGREALVSCDVKQADLDGLLEAVLTPAGLAFERTGQSVKIRGAE